MKHFLPLKTIRISKTTIVKACAVCLGLVFLAAGTGKVLEPNEFTRALEGLFFTPEMASIIAHSLPWLEISLGILLVIGIVPKITSAVSIGLISGFIFSNLWLLMGSGAAITCGDCFGIWERFLGSLSPLQALFVDVALLGLALVVLTQAPVPVRPFRFWAKAGNKP